MQCCFCCSYFASGFLFCVSVFVCNLSSLPVFCVMNVCTFTGYVITLLQHTLNRIPDALFFTFASYVSKVVYKLGWHYKNQVFGQFVQMFSHCSFKQVKALFTCSILGVAGGCGIGLPCVFALTSFKSCLKVWPLAYSFKVPYISTPIDTQPVLKEKNMWHECTSKDTCVYLH